MFGRILVSLIALLLACQMVFAGHYIADNRTTYIGDTELYYCYIYDFDVNMVIRFSDFHQSGNWSATVALEPKLKKNRDNFISSLKRTVEERDTKTAVLPVWDNKFWAFATRLVYDKEMNRLYVKDNFWLNYYGETIVINETNYSEYTYSEYPHAWAIKDLMDKHIHKRYQEEYERRNTVVR